MQRCRCKTFNEVWSEKNYETVWTLSCILAQDCHNLLHFIIFWMLRSHLIGFCCVIRFAWDCSPTFFISAQMKLVDIAIFATFLAVTTAFFCSIFTPQEAFDIAQWGKIFLGRTSSVSRTNDVLRPHLNSGIVSSKHRRFLHIATKIYAKKLISPKDVIRLLINKWCATTKIYIHI